VEDAVWLLINNQALSLGPGVDSLSRHTGGRGEPFTLFGRRRSESAHFRWPQSECFESLDTKNCASMFNRLLAWRVNIVQSVVEI